MSGIEENTIIVAGASTLSRYTQEILLNGLASLGRPVALGYAGGPSASTFPVLDAESLCDQNSPTIIQLHGSPAAAREDAIWFHVAMSRLESLTAPTVILCHRPDELEMSLREPLLEWASVLAEEKPRPGHVVLLGPLLQNCAFVNALSLPCKIIPHGFFQAPDTIQVSPVIVGAHTVWGEMRSLPHAVKLMSLLFQEAKSHGLDLPIGYLGGIPHAELSVLKLESAFSAAGLTELEISNVRQTPIPTQNPKHPTVLVSYERDLPPGMALTFNLQLYHLGKAIRLGESSGSLHRGVSIPVILEMNGAEVLEDLAVVKVPYEDRCDCESANWVQGAREIAALIESKRYLEMLKHNAQRAKAISPTHVAQRFLQILAGQCRF